MLISRFSLSLRRCVVLLFTCGTLAGPLSAAPVLTEIMADNDGSLLDEDGEASDWIEIYNPDDQLLDLSGWHLTDNSGAPAKWTFPAGVTLEPGRHLVVWASGKNRILDPGRLHTNFSLSSGGEYLALAAPGGSPRVSEFSPAFLGGEEGESFGAPFIATSLIDHGSTAQVRIPADASLGSAWTARDYPADAGWTTSPGPHGFGMPAPGFFIEARRSTSAITTITTAESVLNGTNAADRLTAVNRVVNFTGSTGTDGRFGDGEPMLHGPDTSNFAMRATSTIVIPTTGLWTFHVNSDDGFRLRIDGTAVLSVTGVRTAADSFITRTLTAGTHALILSYFENTGPEEIELSAAPGTHTAFSSQFRLVGDTVNGGLPVLAPPDSGAVVDGTDLGPSMLGINPSAYLRYPFSVANPSSIETLDLDVTYNDGFIAYLNGTEVARRNAPAGASFSSGASGTRAALDSLLPEKFNLAPFRTLLVTGPNVLVVQAMNVTSTDSSFHFAPTLTAGRHVTEAPRFFLSPTPGATNLTSGVLGHVKDTQFSHHRGFHSTPFDLTISSDTPGANIRYTIDGSTPTPTRGQLYTGPIPISKTTVVRALAFLPDFEPTNVDTHSFVFLDDVILQGGPTAPYRAKPGPDWPNLGSVSGQIIDYGMDRTIVNHTNATIGGASQIKAALTAIPSVFLTTDLPHLFNATSGIYTHPGSHGRTWERPASIELIGDQNTPMGGFHATCGIRIRGGYSRDTSNPKHSFRIFFRREYGEGTLSYPVFGPAGAHEFDAFDVQCSQNYSWSFGGDSNHNALREIWSRDSHAALGHPATRGRFVHLYLNGVYWGLFQLQERAEAAFGATYLGGNKDDYDVIKHTGSPGNYTTEATDGDFLLRPDGTASAWRKLWNATRASYWINRDRSPTTPFAARASTAQEKLDAYYKIQGLQADGRTPTGEAPLLDVDNLIDYITIVFLARNGDSPLVGDGLRPNNFYSLRNRNGVLGFMSIQHDAEHSLNAGGASDRWGPYGDPATGTWNQTNHSNPQYFHQDLTSSAEYKMKFADHLYRHFFNDGPLTAPHNQARLDARAREIEVAIMAESARWGDSKTSPALNATHWRNARNQTRTWFANRSTQFISEARTRGFYPPIEPPTFSQRGGTVAPGFTLELTNPNTTGGTIYFTTDGSDPRPVGGGFTPFILLPESSTVEYLVPSTTNGGSTLAIADWTAVQPPSNAANWTPGAMGLGFNPASRPATTNFTPFIKTNVQAAMQPAGGTANGSLYVRVPFTVTQAQLDSLDNLRLRIRYDDGYIAYLNGQEIGRKTVTAAFVPAWNSVSTSLHADSAAIVFEDLTVPDFATRLVVGDNVLAFHVMNQTATNSDLLFSVQVEGDTLTGAIGSAYTTPVNLAASTTIRTRVLQGNTWSALNEASFFTNTVPASATNLVVSEFSYNPAGAQKPSEAAYESNDFEFIELQNIGAATVDLYNVTLGGAADLVLASAVQQSLIPPGGRVVVAANPAALAARYGAIGPVIGPFTGSLDNSSETIRLTAADGSIIKQFTYLDSSPWPEAADGDGYSLVLIHPSSNPDHTQASHWRSSTTPNGRPGQPDQESTYSAWKTAEGVTTDDADPDADGLPPLAEYALAASPNVSDGHREPASGSDTFFVGPVEDRYLTISFRRRLDADDVVYDLESSPSLASGPWSPGAGVLVSETNHADGTATMKFRSAQPITSGTTLFLRLRFTTR